MISFKGKGDFKNVERLLMHVSQPDFRPVLEKYGQRGVKALSEATPKDTGLTASSWYYTIRQNGSDVAIEFNNSNVQGEYANVAVLIQLGHATKNGGYVQGIDYINPALQPIFEGLAKDAWREVMSV